MRRRRALSGLFGALACLGMLHFPAPVAASEPIDDWSNCEDEQTDYRWVQASCLVFYRDIGSGSGLFGTGEIAFQTGFNREGVKRCTVYFQLVSSYGTINNDQRSCTSQARDGGNHVFNSSWGPGRQSRDSYRQYVWAEVTTGVRTYSGRPDAALTPWVAVP